MSYKATNAVADIMLRRSPRRRSVSNQRHERQQRQQQLQATSHDDVKDVELLATTPRKRRRGATTQDEKSDKDTAQIDRASSLPCTPLTPDLCASPTVASTSDIDGYGVTVALVDDDSFHDLAVSPSEFRPSASLTTGQSFHWTALTLPSNTAASPSSSSSPSAWGSHDATDWVGTLRITPTGPSIVVHVRETPTTTLYKVLSSSSSSTCTNKNDTDDDNNEPSVDVDAFLREYFQLETSLANLYTTWSRACPRLKQIAGCIPGVRILQQDPWETLLSFICSSNNNIPRITKVLATLRQEYGERIVLRPDKVVAAAEDFGHSQEVYTFPSLVELCQKTTEADLRRLGWGYRAKYVMQTMETLTSLGGEAYLAGLRQETDPAVVQEALLQFAGVGRKVADCVALFSLGQTRAIPVDVHVWNIARRDYDPDQALAHVKSLTPAVYQQVGDIFRNRFGDYAGWAHSLLFVAELPSFRPVLPDTLIHEMKEFRQLEQARKQELKQAKEKKK